MSVEEAQEKIDSREFAWWAAYNQVEPFGEERADYRIAILCSVVANAHETRKGKIHRVKDFMPQFGPREKQSPEQMWAVLELFAKRNPKLMAKANGSDKLIGSPTDSANK